MASKYIFNNSGGNKTYAGQLIADQAYYLIQTVEEVSFSTSSALITDIGSGDAVISKTGDNSGHITNISLAVDYLKNNPGPQDVDGAPLVRPRAFHSSDGFRARFKGALAGTANKNNITDIDYLVSEERYITGVRLIACDAVIGDSVDFQIVDKDNILGYGAGVVLDTFGESWWIDPTTPTQPDVVVSYPAKILAGLYIRVKYTSIGTADDVDVRANLYLHKAAS